MDDTSSDSDSHGMTDNVDVGLIGVGDDSFDELSHSKKSSAVVGSERGFQRVCITPGCGVEFTTGVFLREEVGD